MVQIIVYLSIFVSEFPEKICLLLSNWPALRQTTAKLVKNNFPTSDTYDYYGTLYISEAKPI